VSDAPPTPAGILVEVDDDDPDYLLSDEALDLDPSAADIVAVTVTGPSKGRKASGQDEEALDAP
jgi:hypothetical protein